ARPLRITDVAVVASTLQLRDDPRMDPGVGVGTIVEVVLLSADPAAGTLRYRTRTAPLARGRHPDGIARDLAGLDASDAAADAATGAALLHSTSWRFRRDRVVVTYAALPDPDPAR